jgi:hypothetical protein
MITRLLRYALAPILLAGILTACAAVPLEGNALLKSDAASRPIHAVVDGSALGHTNRDLTQLVSSCLAGMPSPDNAPTKAWEVRVHFETATLVPHPSDQVSATLFDQGKPVASRWTRTLSPDLEARSEFCGSVGGLMQQVLSAGFPTHAPKLLSAASKSNSHES